jgi:hypothetical protein
VVSDILHGRIDCLSLDVLIDMAGVAGLEPKVSVRSAPRTVDDIKRENARKALIRSALKHYELTIDAQNAGRPSCINSDALDSEEAIEAEAVRLCRS